MSLVLPDPAETALELSPPKLRVMIANTRTTIEESNDLKELQRYERRCLTVTSLIREQEDLTDCAFDIEELRIDIKRRIGQVQREQPKNPGGRKPSVSGGSRADPVSDPPPTIAEQGLTKAEAQQSRRLAAIPDETYEQAKQVGREKGKLSAAQVIRETTPIGERTPRAPQGMDLCPTCDGSGYVHKDRAPRVAKPAAKPAKVERSGGSINEPCDGKSHPMFQRSKGVCLGCGQTIGGKK